MRPGILPHLVIGLALASPLTSVQAAGASSSAPGDVAFEVILRDDVPAGAAPSFTVVETDLDGLLDLVEGAGPDQTIEFNGSAQITVADPEAPNQWPIGATSRAPSRA